MKSSEVNSDTRKAVDEHLAGCSDCRSRLSPATVAHPSGGGANGAGAVAAVLFPEEMAGVPRGWVYAVGALASTTLVLAVAVGYLLTRPVEAQATPSPRAERVISQGRPASAPAERPAPREVVEAQAQAAVEEPPAEAPEPAPEPTPAPEAPASSAANKPTTVAAATPKPRTSGATSRPTGSKPKEAETQPPAPETASAPPAPKPQAPAAVDDPQPKPKDEIEKLLFEAAGPVPNAPKVKEEKAPEAEDATGLTKKQVQKTMNSVQDKIHQCSVDSGKVGSVRVRIQVVPSGRVKTVRVFGQYAGTPTGDCVSKAVRSAIFPSFVGQNQHIDYPIPLR